MDAPHWTDDDDRQDERDDERCPECHAGPLEDCQPGCACEHCVRRRAMRHLAAATLGEDEIDLLVLKGML